eukprot:g1358.t1
MPENLRLPRAVKESESITLVSFTTLDGEIVLVSVSPTYDTAHAVNKKRRPKKKAKTKALLFRIGLFDGVRASAHFDLVDLPPYANPRRKEASRLLSTLRKNKRLKENIFKFAVGKFVKVDFLYAHRFVMIPCLSNVQDREKAAPAVRMWLEACKIRLKRVSDISIDVKIPSSWMSCETMAEGLLKIGDSFKDLKLDTWSCALCSSVGTPTEEHTSNARTIALCDEMVSSDPTILERMCALLFFMAAYFHARGESDAAALAISAKSKTTQLDHGGPLLRAILLRSMSNQRKVSSPESPDGVEVVDTTKTQRRRRVIRQKTPKRSEHDRNMTQRESGTHVSRPISSRALMSPYRATSPYISLQHRQVSVTESSSKISRTLFGTKRRADDKAVAANTTPVLLPASRKKNLRRMYMQRLACGRSAHVYSVGSTTDRQSVSRADVSRFFEKKVDSALAEISATHKAGEAVDALARRNKMLQELEEARNALAKMSMWLREAEAERDTAVADADAARRELAFISAGNHTRHSAAAIRIALRSIVRWHGLKRCRGAWAKWVRTTAHDRGGDA